MGVVALGETPTLTEEFIGETHRVLEHIQTHRPGNQHHKGSICLWVAEEVTESQQRGLKARQRLENWGRQGCGWQNERSHICVRINQEEQLGSDTDHANHGSSVGK